jgi:hypothetical protein
MVKPGDSVLYCITLIENRCLTKPGLITLVEDTCLADPDLITLFYNYEP